MSFLIQLMCVYLTMVFGSNPAECGKLIRQPTACVGKPTRRKSHGLVRPGVMNIQRYKRSGTALFRSLLLLPSYSLTFDQLNLWFFVTLVLFFCTLAKCLCSDLEFFLMLLSLLSSQTNVFLSSSVSIATQDACNEL